MYHVEILMCSGKWEPSGYLQTWDGAKWVRNSYATEAEALAAAAEAYPEQDGYQYRIVPSTRALVAAVLALFEVDGEDFYHNESNDYGCIKLKLWTGAGDPWKLYAGEETQANYVDGRRGTGRYLLNAAAVDYVLQAVRGVK